MARGAAIALVLACALAGPAGAAPEEGIRLHFRDAPIAEVVREIATRTGEPFVFDQRVAGRVTISVPEPVSRAEALEILNAALRMKGLAAFPTAGGYRRILPLDEAGALAPVAIPGRAGAERTITTLLRVHEVRPSQLASTLEPLVGSGGVLVPLDDTGALVLASSEARLQRLLGIARTLDRRSHVELALLRLRYRDATDVEELVRETFPERRPGLSEVAVLSDARTNTLIVEAAPDALAEVRAFVERIDRPLTSGGNLHVVRVRNVDPERLAEALRQATPAGAPDEDGELPAAVGSDYSVSVDVPTRSLLIVADARTFRALAELVAELDVAPPQVSVDAYVVEIETPERLELAVDAIIPLTTPSKADDTVAFVRTLSSGAGEVIDAQQLDGSTLLRFAKQPFQLLGKDASGDEVVVGTAPNWSVDVRADERIVATRILLRPHLLVASGEEQEIFVGNNVPLPVAASEAAPGSALTLRTDIQRQDVGVLLRVRPLVGQAGGVRLDLELETTAVTPATLGDVEQVGPTLLKRELQSSLRLEDGEVAVVGARGEPRTLLLESGVPFLKDIPFLGQLFRSTSEEVVEAHTLIAVQARVLRTPEEVLAESVRRRLAFERHRHDVASQELTGEAPWGLLVTTRSERSEAEALAARLAAEGYSVRVRPWQLDGRARFDVLALGFAEFADASEAGLALAREGISPEVVALPAFFSD